MLTAFQLMALYSGMPANIGALGQAEGVAARAGSVASTDAAATASRAIGFDTANLESKPSGYLLDPTHSQNQTKQNWFNRALGFNQSNWWDLASQLHFNPSTAVPTKTSQFGENYEQVISITGANGEIIDTTFVFMKDKAGTVRFVIGIPAKK